MWKFFDSLPHVAAQCLVYKLKKPNLGNYVPHGSHFPNDGHWTNAARGMKNPTMIDSNLGTNTVMKPSFLDELN
ncbi:MAG: hypothetical protein CMI32_00320 [Opitutales bacterium]|nr:hypothetical protein [Opitutales bacterium]